MEITIQQTTNKDFFQTENLTREAFWNLFKPGCDEHLVLHNIRESKAYIPELDLQVVLDGQIIGHVVITLANVVDTLNNESVILSLAPVSVLPELQNKGIGSELINFSIKKAKELGFSGIILFGNPQYYHRFGFKNAEAFEITTKDDQTFEPFMALELSENSLDKIKGRFFEDEAYHINAEELKVFDKKFPHKEKGEPKIKLDL